MAIARELYYASPQYIYINNFKLGFTVQTKTTSSIVDVNDFIYT